MIRDTPHFGLKEYTAVDAKNGFVLATNHSPVSVYDTKFLFQFAKLQIW